MVLNRALPLLGVYLLFAVPALANLTLGAGARDVSMGGAGLASGDAKGSALNPALLAQSRSGLGILWPSVSAAAEGVGGWSDAVQLISNTAMSAAKAYELVESLGTGNTAMEVAADAGLSLHRADLVASAIARTEINPNEAFAAWIKDGMSSEMPEDARADLYAGGIVTLPSVGFGFYLPEVLPGATAVGFRVKPTQVFYSHYIFDADDAGGRPAAEMSGKDYLKSTSVSADMGMIYAPRNMPNTRVALMVNNLIEPKAVTFAVPSERWGESKQLAPRTVSVGTAWVNEGMTLAADLVDLTKVRDKMELRLGAELRLLNGIALRGGYNTRNGVTAGIGLGSFDFAYSRAAPVMLSHSIAF